MALPFLLPVLQLFGLVKSAVVAGVSAVFQVVVKYPIQSAVIVLVAAGAWFLNGWAYERGVKSRDAEVAQMQSAIDRYVLQVEERDLRIKGLEGYSTVLADAIQGVAGQLRKDLKSLTQTYEQNLAEARKNPKIITKVVEVKVPGEDRIIEVLVQDGNVVCDRYPEGYHTTVNQMVKKTREVMRKGLTP